MASLLSDLSDKNTQLLDVDKDGGCVQELYKDSQQELDAVRRRMQESVDEASQTIDSLHKVRLMCV